MYTAKAINLTYCCSQQICILLRIKERYIAVTRSSISRLPGTQCGIPPPPPLRGGYAFSGTEYGDQVTYDCECGYDLEGEQVLTCGETGKWGQPPCCRSK